MGGSEGVTDPAANGEALLVAARLTKEPGLQSAAEAMLGYLLKAAPRTADGTLFHVTAAKEVWIDSLVYGAPVSGSGPVNWMKPSDKFKASNSCLWQGRK